MMRANFGVSDSVVATFCVHEKRSGSSGLREKREISSKNTQNEPECSENDSNGLISRAEMAHFSTFFDDPGIGVRYPPALRVCGSSCRRFTNTPTAHGNVCLRFKAIFKNAVRTALRAECACITPVA